MKKINFALRKLFNKCCFIHERPLFISDTKNHFCECNYKADVINENIPDKVRHKVRKLSTNHLSEF